MPAPRTLALAAAALALGVLAAWFAGGSRRELVLEPLGAIEAASDPARKLGALDDHEIADAAAPEVEREAAASPAGATLPPGANRPTGATVVFVRVAATGGRGPVAGARLSLAPADGTSDARAELEDVTDEEGRGSARVRPGVAWKLRVAGSSFDARTVDVPPLAPGELRLVELEVDAHDDLVVRGRVLADEDGAPVAGAALRRRAPIAEVVVPAPLGTTDALADAPAATSAADGSFELRARSWQDGWVRVDAPGRGPLAFAVARKEPREAPVPRELELVSARAAALEVSVAPGAATSGATHDAPDAAPREVRVSARLADLAQTREELAGRLAWLAPLDGAGRARIEQLPADVPLVLELVAGEEPVYRASEDLVLAPGERRAVSIASLERVVLRGSVVDQHGAPVGDARVGRRRAAAGSQEAWTRFGLEPTDAEGRFELDSVPVGRWVLTVEQDRWAQDDRGPSFTSAELEVDVARGSDELIVTVARGLAIAGTVVDADGLPVAGAQVVAQTPDGGTWVLGVCDASGRFRITPVAACTHELVARPAAARTGSGESSPVLAEAGREDLVLELCRAARVRIELAVPRDGARYSYLLQREHPRPCFGTFRSPREAPDVFDGLRAGRYRAAVVGDDGTCAVAGPFELAAGEQRTIELVPRPAARLRLHGGARGGPRALLVVAQDVAWSRVAPPPNEVVDVWLPPGAVTVERGNGACAAGELLRVELAAGEVRDLWIAGAPR